jgi:hypothetical protein
MTGFKYRPYKDIINGTANASGIRNQDGFNDTKASICGSHQSVVAAELPANRRHQVLWIDKTDALLDGREEPEKAKIVTAMMVLEMCEMAGTYKESIFVAVKPDSKTRNGGLLGNGAYYFRCLQNTIGWTPENSADEEDVRSMLEAAKEFIGQVVYVDGDSRKGFKYKDEFKGLEDHAFASIDGLDISRYLRIASAVIHECSDNIEKRNEDKHAEALQAVEKEKLERAKLEREAEDARLAKLNPQQPGLRERVYSSFPSMLLWGQGNAPESGSVEPSEELKDGQQKSSSFTS